MWFFPSSLPSTSSHTLFKASTPGAVRPLFQFSLRFDGKLSIISNAVQEGEATFSASKVRKGRWAHLAFVWYLRRSSHPNLSECSYWPANEITMFLYQKNIFIGLYVDGVFVEGLQLPYPRAESMSGFGANLGVRYTIGDAEATSSSSMSWCLASAYLLGLPLGMLVSTRFPPSGYQSNPTISQLTTYRGSSITWALGTLEHSRTSNWSNS